MKNAVETPSDSTRRKSFVREYTEAIVFRVSSTK